MARVDANPPARACSHRWLPLQPTLSRHEPPTLPPFLPLRHAAALAKVHDRRLIPGLVRQPSHTRIAAPAGPSAAPPSFIEQQPMTKDEASIAQVKIECVDSVMPNATWND